MTYTLPHQEISLPLLELGISHPGLGVVRVGIPDNE